MEPRERGGRSEQGHWLRPLNAELRSMGFFLSVVGDPGRVSNRGRPRTSRCWCRVGQSEAGHLRRSSSDDRRR